MNSPTKLLWLVALVAAAALPAQGQGNLILNGSFEDPAVGSNGGSLSTTPTDWLQSGGVNSGFFNPSLYNAFYSITAFLPPTDGEQVEEIWAGSAIFQLSVTMVPGQAYRLSFDLSRDLRSTQSSLLQLEIQGYPQILNAYFTSAGDATAWVNESYDFVPTDPLGRYTLSFFDINGYASVLDNVVLVPVPEPSVGVLVAGGLLLALARLRRTPGQKLKH